MRHIMRAVLHGLVFFFMLCVPVFHATGQSHSDVRKEEILLALEKKYANQSFEAAFTQTSNLSALDISETASGKAYFSHPGKMRWQYHLPDRHEIITNGTTLWIHRPDENQVMIGDADAFFKSGGGGAFLSDITLVRKHFTIEVKSQTSEFVELDLTAQKKSADISGVLIRISKQTHQIEKVITTNPYNDTTEFDFFDIRFHGADTPPERFEFKPPEGVSIIDMNE